MASPLNIQSQPLTYWKYIKARFARVYPLHLFTLIWCLVCAIVILHYANGVHPFFDDMLNPRTRFAIPSFITIDGHISGSSVKHAFLVIEHRVVDLHDLSFTGPVVHTSQGQWKNIDVAVYHRLFSYRKICFGTHFGRTSNAECNFGFWILPVSGRFPRGHAAI